MTNFNWIVNALYTETIDGQQDYVVIAGFEVVGVDGQYTANYSNIAMFSTDSVSPFIPYDQLKNDIVINWIQTQLGIDGVNNVYSNIQGQIDSQINPPVVPQNTPLPPDFYTTNNKKKK